MKILMVIHSFSPKFSGAQVQSIYLSKELKRQGVDLDIVINNFTNKTVIEEHEGQKVFKFCTYFDYEIKKFWVLRNFIYFVKVLGLIFKSNYQIVLFISFGGYDSWVLPVLKLFKRKTILQLTLVGGDDLICFKERNLGYVFFPMLRCIDKILSSSTQLNELSLRAGIEKEKIEIIPFGVDVDKFKRLTSGERQVLKENLGYSKFQYVFFAVGQIEVRKGYDFMIKAWKYINKEFPNAVLLIAGPQNNSSNQFYLDLLQYMQSENISNVQFLGLIKNINEHMRISDCLLHCASREGLPNTLLEASIASLPIVCRKIEGITSDIILNPNIGRECATDDPKDFAVLVYAILRERNIDQIDSDFEILKERFDIEQVAKKYINLFNSI